MSGLFEVVAVNLLDGVCRPIIDSNAVIKQETCEAATIDKDKPCVDALSKILGLPTEGRRCDKDALFRSLSLQGARKLLYLWPPHRVLPSLRLDVDGVESKTVLVNDSVDASIPGTANRASCVSMCPSISHRYQEVDDELLEERWGPGFDRLEQFSLDPSPEVGVSCLEGFLR